MITKQKNGSDFEATGPERGSKKASKGRAQSKNSPARRPNTKMTNWSVAPSRKGGN